MRLFLYITVFLLLTISNSFIIRTSEKFHPSPIDTNSVKFTGQIKRVSYSGNRKIYDAPYSINNLSNDTLKIRFIKATLLRGNHEEELHNAQFEIFLSGSRKKCTDFILKPNTKSEFNIVFAPYVIYMGSGYSVKAYLKINGILFESISKLDIYRLTIGDKNKYRNKD
jgi:hypothetical protein